MPRILEEGITEQAAKELLDKALVYINPALGEECMQLNRPSIQFNCGIQLKPDVLLPGTCCTDTVLITQC